MLKGYQAQVKSIVMVKNHRHTLPLKDARMKVYIPKRHFPSVTDFFGNKTRDYWDYPVDLKLMSTYYQVVDTPQEADFALCFIQDPMAGTGYSRADAESGGNGYVPISLQYNDYTATDARAKSLA